VKKISINSPVPPIVATPAGAAGTGIVKQLKILGPTTATPVEVEILAGDSLTVTASAVASEIDASNNIRFTGAGAFRTDVALDFGINVIPGVTVEFAILFDSSTNAAVTTYTKTDKGALKFSSSRPNAFNATETITIQDGSVIITDVNQLRGLNQVIFNHGSRLDREPILTALWTGSKTIEGATAPTDRFQINAVTSGTINVANAGSTLVLGDTVTNTPTATNSVTGQAGVAVKKTGLGTLRANAYMAAGPTHAWDTVDLDIAEGRVFVTASYALESTIAGAGNIGAINVEVEDGAVFELALGIRQPVAEFTGDGTASLQEASILFVSESSAFDGYITGVGNLYINHAATFTVNGVDNDYIGDTHVDSDSTVRISHEHNLGGTRAGKLYLDTLNFVTTGVNLGIASWADPVLGARLLIADDASFVLPNEIVLGDNVATTGQNARGQAVIEVPARGRLEVANNITFNQNGITKTGLGDVVFSSLGYGSVGNGTFDLGTQAVGTLGTNSTALYVHNGRARIENAQAVSLGDILVALGGASSRRPVLSICNGLKLSNAIAFNRQSTFETELITANLYEGTTVPSAVEAGLVVGPGNRSDVVYNRVNFLDLPGGTVTKGSDFQLIKATAFRDYAAENVEPVYTDGQIKAPFDPYFSNYYLFFRATHNIDIPLIGTPNVTQVTAGANYRIVIPVTTTTSLKASSATINTDLPGASIAIDGTTLVVTGTAPVPPTSDDQRFPYRVSVTTNENVATDTLGYESYSDLTLTVVSGTGSSTPTYTEKLNFTNASGTAITSTSSTDRSRIAGSIVIANTSTGAPAAGSIAATVSLYGSASASALGAGATSLADQYTLIESKSVTVVDGAATYEFLPTPPATEFPLGVYHIGLTSDSYAPGEEAALTYTLSETTTPPEDTDRTGSGGGGCDAGFGSLSLLAAGAFVTLRKKG
jgi:hypothetical protein